MKNETVAAFSFIGEIDRYLEVSYQYNRRLFAWKADMQTSTSDRYVDLLEEIQQISSETPSSVTRVLLDEDAAKGEEIRFDKRNIEITENYLYEARTRVLQAEAFQGNIPKNFKNLKKLLNKNAKDYLSSFESTSYAWDALVKLVSLSSLPSQDTLYARDMLSMHVAEFKQHLRRVAAHADLLTPDKKIELHGALKVSQMEDLQCNSKLVRKIVEESVCRNIDDLIDELVTHACESIQGSNLPSKNCLVETASYLISSNKEYVISLVEQVDVNGLETASEDMLLRDVACANDRIISLGLVLGYLVAISFAVCSNNKSEQEVILRHGLFCTRSLLDEKRWAICRDLSALLRQASYCVHGVSWSDECRPSCGMLEANWLFSRKECGEDISSDLTSWRVEEMADRFLFLREVLFEHYDNAISIAERLTKVCESGHMNMTKIEFEQWPILERFRESSQGASFMAKLS